MQTILIAGVDSVVGANAAAVLSGRFRVVGLSFGNPPSLAGCEIEHCGSQNGEGIRRWFEAVRPDRLLYCGPAAINVWQADEHELDRTAVHAAKAWGRACRENDAQLTLMSSDAIFTSPWMFHEEDSSCRCQTAESRTVQSVEEVAVQQCPEALLVRTHAYGWQPESTGMGWIEETAHRLEMGTAGPYDFQRHATPILATQLAEIIAEAWDAALSGVYHIAGGERTNPNQFVHRLADALHLPDPNPVDGNSIQRTSTGFGAGETSLHCRKIRKALDRPLPTIAEGLAELREQKLNGHLDRLNGLTVLERAA